MECGWKSEWEALTYSNIHHGRQRFQMILHENENSYQLGKKNHPQFSTPIDENKFQGV
jgi:hypothetical protein